MSFIFGKKADDSSVVKPDPGMTQGVTRMSTPFSKYLVSSTPDYELTDIDQAELPPLPEAIEPDITIPVSPTEPEVVPDIVIPDSGPIPEPVPTPDVVIPDPEPVPEPSPRGDNVAQILEQMTGMIEQMNAAVMSRVDNLEAAVANRSKEIRESFYQSHLDVIDVSKKLKQAMYESELQDLDIQKRTLAILDATEDKSLERAAKIKSLGIFGE